MYHMAHRFILGIVGMLTFLLSGGFVFAGTGFVESPMWLYPESPKEGQTVILSALFRNGEKYPLTGNVLFYDGDVLLDEKTIRIAPGGVTTAVTSFRIGAGSHDFRASVSGLSEVTSNGGVVPIALPLQAATMRKVHVSKDTPLTGLAAQVSAVSNTSTSPILTQVSALEGVVVSAIPEPVKTTATQVAQIVDEWRNEQVQYMTTLRDEAKLQSKEHAEKAAKAKTDKTLLSASDRFVDGPWSTIKSIGLSVGVFIFSLPALFYLLGCILVFLMVRFLVRKIIRIIKNARDGYHRSHIPRAPSI